MSLRYFIVYARVWCLLKCESAVLSNVYFGFAYLHLKYVCTFVSAFYTVNIDVFVYVLCMPQVANNNNYVCLCSRLVFVKIYIIRRLCKMHALFLCTCVCSVFVHLFPLFYVCVCVS